LKIFSSFLIKKNTLVKGQDAFSDSLIQWSWSFKAKLNLWEINEKIKIFHFWSTWI